MVRQNSIRSKLPSITLKKKNEIKQYQHCNIDELQSQNVHQTL